MKTVMKFVVVLLLGFFGVAQADQVIDDNHKYSEMTKIPGVFNTFKAIHEAAEKVAIAEVHAKYALTIDTPDPEGFAALFTEDAVWENNLDISLQGREAMRFFAQAMADFLPGTNHIITNPVIELRDYAPF